METNTHVYVIAEVLAKPGQEDQLRAALQRLVTVTQQEQGFLRYDLHEHHAQPGRFAFYEIWADQAALDAHADTEDMRRHAALTADWVESVSVSVYRKIS